MCKKLISSILCLSFLAGCAVKPLPHAERARLERLGVATVHYAPEMDVSIASRGQSTAGGAATGALATALAPAVVAGPYGAAVTIFFWPILATVGATVGAAGGYVGAYSAKEVKENAPLIEAYIYTTEFQRILSQKVVTFTRQRTSQSLAQTDLIGSESPDHFKDFRNETQLDTILEVGISRINLSGPRFLGGPLTLHVKGFSRLVRVSDGELVLKNDYTFDSIARELDVWAAKGGKLLQEELRNAFDVIASEVVDAHFIENIKFPRFSASLKQVKPKFKYFFSNLKPLRTLRPQLGWQAFPAEEDLAHPEFVWLINAKHIVYDLQYFIRGQDGQLSSLTTRYGIKQPSYRFKKPLEHNRTYAWRVRARFWVDGVIYATPWRGYYSAYQFRTPSQ